MGLLGMAPVFNSQELGTDGRIQLAAAVGKLARGKESIDCLLRGELRLASAVEGDEAPGSLLDRGFQFLEFPFDSPLGADVGVAVDYPVSVRP
jgi:hypothetical protein